jgi:uncharacterized protein YdhG (YjbR/CyaY superfamily)
MDMAQTKDKKSATGPADVDAFIAALPEEAQESLKALRKSIKTAVPGATEVISYGVPGYRLNGRALVSFGAAKDHCSFYIMSTVVTDAHRDELKGYRLGKGSVSFPPGTRLPDALVKKLIKARIAENEALKAR